MDMDFLLSNNAFDTSKILENLNEKMQEFSQYNRSMLVIDVDSIVGVTESISESNMGPSSSYSLGDQSLFKVVVHYANSLPFISKEREQ